MYVVCRKYLVTRIYAVRRKYLVYRIAKVEEERKAKEEMDTLHKRRLDRDWIEGGTGCEFLG